MEDARLVELLKEELATLTHRARHIQLVLDDFGIEPVSLSPTDISQAQHIRNILEENAKEGVSVEEVKTALAAKKLDVSTNYMYAVLRRAKVRNGRFYPTT
jgi:hypothetical protein